MDDSLSSAASSAGGGRLEPFTGAKGQDVGRWLARLARMLKKEDAGYSNDDYMQELNVHLDRAAAVWADKNYRVKNIIGKTENVTDEEVAEVKDVFRGHWQLKGETTNAIPALHRLHQEPGERGAASEPDSAAVSSIQEVATNRFIDGLNNTELQLRMLRMPHSGVRTLRGVLDDVESQVRIMGREKEVMEAGKQKQEVEVLREVAIRIASGRALIAEQKVKINEYLGPAPPAPPHSAPPIADNQVFRPPPLVQTNPHQVTTGGIPTVQPPMQQGAKQYMQQQYAGADPLLLANSIINSSVRFLYELGNPLCTNCGNKGHIYKECNQIALQAHERSFLYEFTRLEREKGYARRDARMAQDAAGGNAINSNIISLHTSGPSTAPIPQLREMPANDYKWTPLPKHLALSVTARTEAQVFAAGDGKRPRLEDDGVEELNRTQCDHLPGGPQECKDGACEHLCCRRPIKALKKTAQSKQKKPQRPIKAMEFEKQLSVKDILMGSIVTMPVAHLAQLSPFFWDEAKRLFTVLRQKRAKKAVALTTAAAQPINPAANSVDTSNRLATTEGVTGEIRKWSEQERTCRAFSLPATVWKTGA
ncbi:hypothetical protein LTR74_011786 [Friedmanniomyces endolithicus]|nr:hypothetical protein LTR74_011786 [Friedmanniomyces endolithicus]